MLTFVLYPSELLLADDKLTPAVQLYKQNYFIGDRDRDAKFQLSYRIRLWEFSDSWNLFLSQTHKADWAITTEKSAPFMEHNFNPEIHLRWKTPDNYLYLKHAQIGIEHESTGVADSLSRAWNRFTGQVEWTINSKNQTKPWHVHTYLRGWYIFDKDEDNNSDIGAHLGYGEFGLSYTVHALPKVPAKSVLALTARFRSFMLEYAFNGPGPDFLWYVQYWHGRGEWLVGYKEDTNIVRAGIRFHLD